MVAGFSFLREEIARRINQAKFLMLPLLQEWRAFQELPEKAALEYMREIDRHDPRLETMANSYAEGGQLYADFLIVTPDDLLRPLGKRSAAFLTAFSFMPGEVNLDLKTPLIETRYAAVRSPNSAGINSC